jgi:hypothetical protein
MEGSPMFRRLMQKLIAVKELYPVSTFKVVGVNGEPQNKNIKVIYQVSGKSAISTEKPEVLIRELMHINDSELIYNLALAEKMSHSFRILSILFDDVTVKFEIEDLHSKFTLILKAEEILSSNNMLENFSQSDLTMIYYQLLHEVERKQKILKSQLRHQSINETKNGIYLLKDIGVNE